MTRDKAERRRRRKARESERLERRNVRDAMVVLGEALLRARASDVHIAEGFADFGAYCRARVPAMCPAWKLTGAQVDELVAMVLEVATRHELETQDAVDQQTSFESYVRTRVRGRWTVTPEHAATLVAAVERIEAAERREGR